MLIIGFGNKARHGKDTAGEAVVDYFNGRIEFARKWYGPVEAKKLPTAGHYKFASALYRECRDLHSMREKDAPLLQRIGMERRAENPDYWVNQVVAEIAKDNPGIAVITDVRFRNEAEFIKRTGGILVNVSRLNTDGTPYVAPDRRADHQSELELDDYPWNYFIKAYTGESILVEQLAIFIADFERSRR